MLVRSILFFSFVLASPISFAAEKDNSCPSLVSTKDLYSCTLKNHPDFKGAQLTFEAAEASRDTVTRWPNPELSMKSVGGEVAGEKVGNTEVEVSLDLTELLIKRPALFSLGRAEEKVLTVEAQERTFAAKLNVLRSIYRYRQLLDELELVNEALSTFQKIEGQLQGRRARGPEQEITLSLVQLAQGDHQLRKNHLSVEKAEIEANFKGIMGDTFEFNKQWLPGLKNDWPQIADVKVSNQTFELQKLEAQKTKLEAEKSIAVSESWPKLSAGPVWERDTEGPVQVNTYGFNLSVDIPIFSWNAGARNLASKNLARAEFDHSFAAKKADLQKRLLIQRYNSAVESLKKAVSSASLKQKHSKIDSLFRQGLTSGASVIEVHRQIAEFTESQHEHELTALESLMYLKLLSGENPEEVIR